MSWYVAAILILLLALALNLGLLAFVMYALLAALVISRWLSRMSLERIEIKRECNRTLAAVGDTVAIIVTIRNSGPWPIPWLLVEDMLPREALIHNPPSLRVSGRRLALLSLKPRETRRLLYQVTCNCRGYYQIGPAIIETGDLFGLHRRYRVSRDPHFLTVLPSAVPLQGYDIASRRPIGEVQMSYRLYEDPTRIAGVRRYQPGDPLYRVHWRATARSGELQSKVYEPSTVAGATLVLDFHRDSYDSRHEPMRSELAITAAASIANAIYEMGQQVGLVTNGRDAVERVRTEGIRLPPRSRSAARSAASMQVRSTRLQPVVVETTHGAAQQMQILEALARLELTDGLRLPELLLETNNRIPRDATVIVILPRVTAAMAIALGNLALRGLAVAAIVNVYEELDFAPAAGMLWAQGVTAYHLRDEAAVTTVCQRWTLSGVGG